MVFLFLFLNLLNQQDFKNPQVANLLKESREPSQHYARLFQNGAVAEVIYQLAESYKKISKPIQAQVLYQKALAIDSQHAGASKGLEEANRRLAWLDQRIKTLDEESQKNNDHQKLCGKAAVLFHLGREEDALDTLQAGHQKFTGTQASYEIRSLYATFRRGQDDTDKAVAVIEREFDAALAAKNLQMAFESLGGIAFLRYGRVLHGPYLEKLIQVFPEVNANFVEEALSMLKLDAKPGKINTGTQTKGR